MVCLYIYIYVDNTHIYISIYLYTHLLYMSNLWGVYVLRGSGGFPDDLRGQVDMVSFALLIDWVANQASNATEVGTAQ